MKKLSNVLNVEDVVTRISQGDFPVVASSYSYASRFDDGTEVPHQVMQSAVGRFNMLAPARGGRWAMPDIAEMAGENSISI